MGPCKDPRWLVPEACTPAPVSLQMPLLFLIWVLMFCTQGLLQCNRKVLYCMVRACRPAPLQPPLQQSLAHTSSQVSAQHLDVNFTMRHTGNCKVQDSLEAQHVSCPHNTGMQPG